MYQFLDNTLYRRRPNGVKLKCICQEEGKELLAEIHKGMCGSHIGSRALVGKDFRQGFYWPTTLQDAIELVTKSEACQFHSKNILKYLKRTKDMFLIYGGDEELVVKGYVDASFNTDLDDSKSQTGYVYI